MNADVTRIDVIGAAENSVIKKFVALQFFSGHLNVGAFVLQGLGCVNPGQELTGQCVPN